MELQDLSQSELEGIAGGSNPLLSLHNEISLNPQPLPPLESSSERFA